MASTLRPLTTVEILDAAWQTLRRRGAGLYAASSIGTLPLALLLVGYFQWLGTLVAGTENDVFYLGTGIWAFGMAAAWTILCVARASVTLMAIADIRGETPDWSAAWQRAWRHAAGSAYVGLVGFAVGWSGGACLGAGLYPTLGWWVARPVLLEEERPFGAALRRSWRLTEGHRGKSFGLWLLFVALWGLGLLNLNLLLNFVAGFATELFGIDTSGLAANFHLGNQAYTTFLCALLLVLLDPVKTVVDAVFYLDLRIRREGADLHQRLGDAMAASESGSRAATAVGVALVLLALTVPAHAMPVDSYLNRVRELRRQVESAPSPNKVDPVIVADLRHQLVDLPGGQKITVRNEWLQESLDGWRAGGTRDEMLHRLQALERSLGGVGAAPSPTTPARPPKADTESAQGGAPSAAADPKETLKSLLQEPEFQPLAERDELRGLVKSIDLSKTKNWWDAFVKWIQKVLFKPAQPKVPTPNWQPPDLRIPIYIVLGIGVLFVLALLARWFVERPLKEETRVAAAVANAAKPPLTASATENALDHTVDEWEQFAEQWLHRGDVRQAIRALYLATLVHLHREGRIDYNRAFTNWVYVRHFRGEAAHQGTLRRLTRMFDEVWYGDREYGEEQYRTFEQGVRELGTPAPGTEPLRV